MRILRNFGRLFWMDCFPDVRLIFYVFLLLRVYFLNTWSINLSKNDKFICIFRLVEWWINIIVRISWFQWMMLQLEFNMASERIDNLKNILLKSSKGNWCLKNFGFEKYFFWWTRVRPGNNRNERFRKIYCCCAGNMWILKPYRGSLTVKGTIAPLIELGAGSRFKWRWFDGKRKYLSKQRGTFRVWTDKQFIWDTLMKLSTLQAKVSADFWICRLKFFFWYGCKIGDFLLRRL